jgi:hypothetical protein
MSCCGQRRSTFTARPPVARPAAEAYVRPPRAPPAPAPQSGGMVALRSVSTGGMVVRGPATGRQYSFSAAAPVQMVEVRDAAALLRTSWFQRA